MKIDEVVPYSLATRALFDAHYDDLIKFDPKFQNPFKSTVWQPKIEAAEKVIVTMGMRNQNKEDTRLRNELMHNCTPILKDLEYKTKQCIDEGTITDCLSSFGLSALNKSIVQNNINSFHLAFEISLAKVQSNQVALTAKGFTADKTNLLISNHNKAYALQDAKIELQEEISDLSSANQVILNDLLNEDQIVITALRYMAEATGNEDLKHKATKAAILSTVVPTRAKKPRNRTVPKASSIIINSNLVAKNLLQLNLKTDVKLTLCRVTLKTEECTTGIDLPFNTLWEGKKADIPGSGEYIKLTNKSATKDAIVSYYEIDVKR